jgi:alkylhydroperoxidase family enzyme
VWTAVKRDWRSAPVDDKHRATLGFIEKMTLRPQELAPRDTAAVLDAGVSRQALIDPIHVAALFNMIVRLADSLGWDVPAFEEFHGRADRMLAGGYRLE